jgi:hypothetical protein
VNYLRDNWKPILLGAVLAILALFVLTLVWRPEPKVIDIPGLHQPTRNR